MIHVIWLGLPGMYHGVWYSRSLDGGKTFEAERNLLDTRTGCNGAAITADATGGVFVAWLDGRLPEDPDSPVSSPIFCVRSADNGATFSRNDPVKTTFPGRACACCGLTAQLTPDGTVYIPFRSGYRSIRDFYLLEGRTTGQEFRYARISDDNWEYNAYPMSGASFAAYPDRKRLAVAWMSRGRVYWSLSQDSGRTFRPRITLPQTSPKGNYPTILMGRSGEVFVTWTEGQDVHWARYTADGTFTGERGTAGMTAPNARPTALVGPDGRLYIIL